MLGDIIGLFFVIIFSIAIYGISIYMFIHPEETFMWGKRWMFENDDSEIEPSEFAIDMQKISAVFIIIVTTIFLLKNILSLIR
ncbi:hypothetical protein [Alkaliphilus peptidifermentans]|uniref:DUF6199 domain-containing protein n=1 Tax=Alkaliphilus peptidifermentans DSM 18978 TaxID=1120976 RepID=A0A1G5JRM8_9FIRM|nr:hypothetical protein [Alkaliphilus peptidifermentans]SCY90329.1 hypothetical protein SAMN03080606_02953 [Alkaliphilus peptidifermentans DSM 18978]